MKDLARTDQLLESVKKAFQSTRNLGEIRLVVADFALSLSQDPEYSELAFKRLLSLPYGVNNGEVRDFLLDRNLNPASARNYTNIILDLGQQSASPPRRYKLCQIILDNLRLGVVSHDDVVGIILHLSNVKIRSGHGVLRLADSQEIHKFYKAIYQSLCDCNIFSFSDLNRELVHTWVTRIKAAPFAPDAADLIWALRDESSGSDLDVVTNLASRWLEHLQQKDLRYTNPRHLAQFLVHLPLEILRGALVGVMKNMIVAVQGKQVAPAVLETWRRTLFHVNQYTLKQLIDHNLTRRMQRSADELPFTPGQDLIIMWWTVVSLANGRPEGFSSLDNLDFQTELHRAFPADVDESQDLLAAVLRTIQSLPLPKTNMMIGNFNRLTNGYLLTRRVNSQRLKADLDTLLQRSSTSFLDDRLYVRTRRHFNDSLTRIAESINTDLGSFLRVSRTLISKDKESIRIVTRILKHNQSLKLAISQFSRSRSLTDAVSSRLVTRDHSSPQSSLLTPIAGVRLLHSLAVSFAVSPAISARQAFRKVYWCYIYLHRYGGPIGSAIARSLWHAGVTRCKETGTSPDKVRWILSIVRSVEGADAAEQLLWNEAIRAEREEDMLKYADEEHPGHRGDAQSPYPDLEELDELLDDDEAENLLAEKGER